MPTIAYLANLFPSPTERYVAAEVCELRRRGIDVIPCSVRRPGSEIEGDLDSWVAETVYLQPLHLALLLQAAWLCLRKLSELKRFLSRILFQGNELPGKRLRALAHTFLGAYYAVVLKKFRVRHIHVHHGYFGSWVGMVAARLLGVEFSMTLHGSDILLHPSYLDLKLELCRLCLTISEFNRQHLLGNYPQVDARKIVVQRLGIDCGENRQSLLQRKRDQSTLTILSAGRLHPVKDHVFLVRACRELKERAIKFTCVVAGEGPERRTLERMIRNLGLQNEVRLLGQVDHQQMSDYYEMADLVVLSSRSEGIPLVLMEAMAHQKVVLAPDITGIPELILDGKTGFLYRPGSLEDFVARVAMINDNRRGLDQLRRAARQHVLGHFNRQKNLAAFCDRLVSNLAPAPISNDYVTHQEVSYENPVLQ